MKPMNFPGRKNDRRKGALERCKRVPEIAVLKCRILPDTMARGVRTKKDRRDRAKFALRG